MAIPPLCLQHFVELYHNGLLNKSSIFKITEEYEVISNKFGENVHIMYQETSRHVYLCKPIVISGDLDSEDESLEIQLRRIIGGVNPNINTWSLVIPIGDKTFSLSRNLYNKVTGLNVSGHCTLLIIEKEHNIIDATVINPHPITYFYSWKLQETLDFIFPKITFTELSAGVQCILDNTLCVYYVFKIIYFYLMDGADLYRKNLINRLCPYSYKGLLISFLSTFVEFTKRFTDCYGHSHEYLSDYDIEEIQYLCFHYGVRDSIILFN